MGDYEKLLREHGKEDSLWIILGSIAHELTHYYQWINNLSLTECGMERYAKAYVDYCINYIGWNDANYDKHIKMTVFQIKSNRRVVKALLKVAIVYQELMCFGAIVAITGWLNTYAYLGNDGKLYYNSLR